MPEYLGYKSRGEGVDFAGEARKLAEQITGIEQRRTLEKEELDAMNNLDMQLFQSGNNQTMNDFALNGADVIRGNMHTWNKQLKAGMLSPKEYKAKITNARADWGSLAEIAKTYDQRFMKQMERQQQGLASSVETYGLEHFADLADLESKSVYVDPNTGRVLLSNTDSEGRYVGQPIDMNHINNPGNVVDAKVDVTEQVGEAIKNWETFQEFNLLNRGATESSEDVRGTEGSARREVYNQAVAQLAQTMISQPNAVASIIADNGVSGVMDINGIEYNISSDLYMTPEEKTKNKISQLENLYEQMEIMGKTLSQGQAEKFLDEVDKYMIQVTKDPNGTFTTQPTKFQKEKAIERIKSEVEITLGHKESGTKGYKPTKPKDTSKDDRANKMKVAGWQSANNAINTGDFGGMDVKSYEYQFLDKGGTGRRLASGEGYLPEVSNSVIVRDRKSGEILMETENPIDLAPFVYGNVSPAEAKERYIEADAIMQSSAQSNNAPEGGQAR